MIEPDAYLPGESPDLEYVYNNESEEEPVYWPVYFTQLKYPKDARRLYNDDEEDYIAYSGGWNTLFVTKQKDGRYKNISVRAVSGDSFGFYLSAGLLSDGIPTYFSGPATTSGNYSVLTEYLDEEDARTNRLFFTSPADNAQVYTFPKVNVVNFMRLHHSGESYRLYQFLPRTLIQVDDLEADVIDAVTIRVSDSIVVTADDLADGSITGAKILAGTVSGVLITPGTITANEISVGQLDAIASNMGTLFVNSGITIGEDGFLWTGPSISGEVLLTKDGLEIDNAFSLGSEVFSPGGGSRFIFSYAPKSRLIRYYPTNYTSPITAPPTYTLTTYSGSMTYFDISASQLGKTGQNQDGFNGYASRIQTGYEATSDIRNDYAETTISTTASGQAYLSLSARTWDTTASRISLTAGTPGNRISITGNEFNVQTTTNLVKDNLTVYKDVSQESPYIKFYSNILEASSSSFKYRKPTTSAIANDSLDLFTIDNTGNGSLYGSLTVSGQVLAAAGSLTDPTYSFFGNPDTGMYAVSNGLAFSINGEVGAVLTANKVLSVNGTNQNGQITVEVPDGTARNALAIRQLNDASAFINFQATLGAGAPIQTSALGTYYGKVRVQANGSVRWIALYNT